METENLKLLMKWFLNEVLVIFDKEMKGFKLKIKTLESKDMRYESGIWVTIEK